MFYSEIKRFDVASGDGCRVSLFVSGCDLHCKGCFNSEAWDFRSGAEFTSGVERDLLDMVDDENIAGLTLLGGDPLNPRNIHAVAGLVRDFRDRFGDTKTIWVYTGYTLRALYRVLGRDPDYLRDLVFVLGEVDVLVDGPYVEGKRDMSNSFRGSTNQCVRRLR